MEHTEFTNPDSPNYNKTLAESLPRGVALMEPKKFKGCYLEVTIDNIIIGIAATLDPRGPEIKWRRVGDEVSLNGRYGGPKGTKGKIVAISEPFSATHTNNILLVRLSNSVDWFKLKDFEPLQ
jgi:hypothetical protein